MSTKVSKTNYMGSLRGEAKEICRICGFTFYKSQIKQQDGKRVCFRCFDPRGSGNPPDINPAKSGSPGLT